jgi:hypothetical protein
MSSTLYADWSARINDVPEPILDAFAVAWDAIRALHPDQPIKPVLMELAPRPWAEKSGSNGGTVNWARERPLIIFDNEILDKRKPQDQLAWLLHLAAHSVVPPTGTGSGRRYHSAAFRDVATALGLTVTPSDYDYGYTELSAEDAQRYRSVRLPGHQESTDVLAEITQARKTWKPLKPSEPAQRGDAEDRNGIVLVCLH